MVIIVRLITQQKGYIYSADNWGNVEERRFRYNSFDCLVCVDLSSVCDISCLCSLNNEYHGQGNTEALTLRNILWGPDIILRHHELSCNYEEGVDVDHHEDSCDGVEAVDGGDHEEDIHDDEETVQCDPPCPRWPAQVRRVTRAGE